MTSFACRVLKLGTVRGQVCPDSRCTAFLAASSLVGLFDESKRGEGERVPNPGAALSLSFSLSLSAHRGPLASPRLSPSASQACSHSPPFLLDFTSHTLVCFETSHTLAFTPVFSDLRSDCQTFVATAATEKSPNFGHISPTFIAEVLFDLRRPVVEPASSSFKFLIDVSEPTLFNR